MSKKWDRFTSSAEIESGVFSRAENVVCPRFPVLIAERRVGLRPGRIEPRALKRRANAYPLLTKPRTQARAEVREHGHPKKQR